MKPSGKRRSSLKVYEQEEQGEESWVISYADLMTLLFGFFVILYSFSTVDEKKYEKMTEEIASAFKSEDKAKFAVSDTEAVTEEGRKVRALRMLVAMMNLGGSLDESVRKIEKQYAQQEDTKGLKDLATKVQGQGNKNTVKPEEFIELIIPGEALFKPGSYDVIAAALPYLKGLANDIKTAKEVGEVVISGHTDSTKPSQHAAYKSNFILSSMRAGMVAEELIRFGIEPTKIRVRGVGSLEPLLPDFDANGQAIASNMAKNRRVQITIKRRGGS